MLYRQDEINNWAAAKGIHASSTAEKQFTKLFEEYAELYGAVQNNDLDEIKDAIGDCYVVLTNIAWFWGLQGNGGTPLNHWVLENPPDTTYMLHALASIFVALRWGESSRKAEYKRAVEYLTKLAEYGPCKARFSDCIDQAVDTILKRTGKMVDGVFVKDA